MGIEIRAVVRSGEGAGQDPGCASWLAGREEAVREGEQRPESFREGTLRRYRPSGGVQSQSGVGAFACIGGGCSSWPDVRSFWFCVRDNRHPPSGRCAPKPNIN